MPRISSIVAALAVAQTATAWTFVWNNKEGTPSIEWGSGTKGCKDIDHGTGKHFNWDPKGDGLCILMYASDDCSGNVIGRSCPIWSKNSSGEISAFRVVDSDFTKSDSAPSRTTTESSTSKTTSASITTTTSDPTTTNPSSAGSTSEPTAAPSSEDEGLSGGAIAGIVVGIVAALALVGLIGWILYRRHQRNANRPKSLGPSSFGGAAPAVKVSSIQQQQQPGPPKSPSGGSQNAPESPSAVKWGGPSSPTEAEPVPEPYTTRPPAGTRLVELSDTSQLVELDGSGQR